MEQNFTRSGVDMIVQKIYIVFSILLTMLIAGQPMMADTTNDDGNTPPDSPKDVAPLKVGDIIPDVTLVADNDESINLIEAVKDAPAILIFYRGGW